MNKKVLLVTSPFRPNVGGVETHLDDLVSEGMKRGISFTVVTYQPLVTKAKGAFKEILDDTVIYRVPWPRFNLFLRLIKFPILEFIYLFPGLFIGSFICMVSNFRQITTIHGQGLVAGTVSVILAKIFGKKIIISTHSIYKFPKGGMYYAFAKWLFRNSDHVLTLSRQSKQEIMDLGINKNKVSQFTYWVDLKKFKNLTPDVGLHSSKLRAKNKRGWGNKFIVLFVGRLIKEKGILQLLESAETWNKNITLVIAGSGPLEEEIQNWKSKIKNLVFLGKIDNDKLPLYYNASDVLIVPSIHEEGYGRVILEATACGTPVIGSNRGGIRECLNKDVGILIDVTPESIKAAVEKIYKNKNLLDRLSSSCIPYAQRMFSESNVEQIVKYYE